MAFARRSCTALVVGLASALTPALAVQALAQGGPASQPQAQQDRPRRHTPQATPAPPRPLDTTDATARKSPRVGATAGKTQVFATPVFSSAIHSRYSQPASIARSTTGECRAQCAEAWGQCFNADSVDTSGCDPGWTQCLSACAGLTYSRGP